MHIVLRQCWREAGGGGMVFSWRKGNPAKLDGFSRPTLVRASVCVCVCVWAHAQSGLPDAWCQGKFSLCP